MARQVPGLLTRTIAATVRPRNASRERSRAGLGGRKGGSASLDGPEPTLLRYSRRPGAGRCYSWARLATAVRAGCYTPVSTLSSLGQNRESQVLWSAHRP